MPASPVRPGSILVLLLSGAAPAARFAAPTPQESGREIFNAVCAPCHTIQPPPDKAPPMIHIAQRYRAVASDFDDAVALVADWIREPDAGRSLLPVAEIERYGVMPQIGLGEDRIDAVARYVLTLADSADGQEARVGAGRGSMAP
ncbi:MAG: cytochrome c [Gemmatimonadota bacterium]|jgi:mono/diheme cytochrome c family protein